MVYENVARAIIFQSSSPSKDIWLRSLTWVKIEAQDYFIKIKGYRGTNPRKHDTIWQVFPWISLNMGMVRNADGKEIHIWMFAILGREWYLEWRWAIIAQWAWVLSDGHTWMRTQQPRVHVSGIWVNVANLSGRADYIWVSTMSKWASVGPGCLKTEQTHILFEWVSATFRWMCVGT